LLYHELLPQPWSLNSAIMNPVSLLCDAYTQQILTFVTWLYNPDRRFSPWINYLHFEHNEWTRSQFYRYHYKNVYRIYKQAVRTQNKDSRIVPGSRKASANKILYYLIYSTNVIYVNFELFELQTFRKIHSRKLTLFRATILWWHWR
jgi:hypothetical protein